MKQYDCILYDLDGTLLDTHVMNSHSLLRVLHEEGLTSYTLKDMNQFFAMPGMDVMILLKLKEPEKAYARWVHYANGYEAIVYEGVLELLKKGKHLGFKQGVVSSKMRKQYQIDFVSKGLDAFIDVAVLKDDTERHKPFPDPLLKACQDIGVQAHKSIYVGDAYTDYVATQAAGMDFIYTTWGSVSGEGIDHPTHITHTVADLIALIDRL